jgi:hypothetical protein
MEANMGESPMAAGPTPAGGSNTVKEQMFLGNATPGWTLWVHHRTLHVSEQVSSAPQQVRTPHRCPVCNGVGRVKFDPLDPFNESSTTAPTSWQCHGCGGAGVVWS